MKTSEFNRQREIEGNITIKIFNYKIFSTFWITPSSSQLPFWDAEDIIDRDSMNE